MIKYYEVIRENFLWEVGAIIKNTANNNKGYEPIDDIFKIHEEDGEYISSKIIEDSPEYFRRVYPVNLATSIVYRVKEEAKAMVQKEYRQEKK
jgi:hypothetical protein